MTWLTCKACRLFIFSSDSFVHLDLETILYILQWDCLKVGEEKLWENVLEWIENQEKDTKKRKLSDKLSPPNAKKQKLNDGQANNTSQDDDSKKDEEIFPGTERIKLLRQIRPLMRFGLMSAEFFVQNVKPQNFLSDKDIADILCYIAVEEGKCGIFSTKKRSGITSEPSGWENCEKCGGAIEYRYSEIKLNRSNFFYVG